MRARQRLPEHGRPLAVVRARTTADVAATVAVCARHRAPVVPRGAGTGVSGGANAVDGGVVVSTERMRDVVEINVIERTGGRAAGVVNDDLRAAAEHGLWYPPDPASAPWSTIGGNVATNAGGLCCVKYGVTRDYVLALEVVTAAGEVVRLGRRTAKGVAGYDLVGLMVGSEGTLGVITEVTVRLRPPARPRRAPSSASSTPSPACGAGVAGVAARGLQPGRVRADRPALPARRQRVEERRAAGGRGRAAARPDRPARAGAEAEAAAILAEFEAAGAETRSCRPTESRPRRCSPRGGSPTRRSSDGRRLLIEDVCLPRARLPR